MGTISCHSNQSSYLIGIKKHNFSFPLPIDAICEIETEKIVNFLFSHYKSMGTISCHSNQSSYPTGIKNTTFVEGNFLSMYAKFQLLPLMVSEKKIFKHFYEN